MTESKTFNCPTCRKTIAKTAVSCPKCGHLITQLDLTKAEKSEARSTIFSWVVGLSVAAWILWPDSPEDIARKQEEAKIEAIAKAADKQKGFHCLSSWDGSFRPAVAYVEKRLKVPSSFEHVSTKVAPKAENGRHGFYMTYRGENGFGGISVNKVSGLYTNEGCDLVEISFES